MGSFLKIKGLPKVLSATGALVAGDIKSQSHWIVDTASQTFTLPSPGPSFKNKSIVIGNTSNGDAVFSGAFIAGASSATLGTGRIGLLLCLPTTEAMVSTYKWALMGLPATVSPEGLTVNELAAVQGAATPSGANVFATMADIPADELTADELAAVQGAAAPDAGNVFATMADIPADELTADELAAVQGAASPDGTNVFATMADIPDNAAGFDYVRSGLTGGTASDLDGISYAALSEGHTCMVNVSGQVYTYRFNASSAAAESSPDTIKPDDAGANNGRWILDTLDGNMYEFGTAANTACQGNDARLPTTAQKAALVDYECTALTGGAAGALDALAVATLTDLEIARVVASNVEYMYQFNAAAVDAEASPTYIRPDDFGAAGVWYLMTVPGQVVPYGTAANTATVGNDARLPTTAQKTALFDYSATSLTGGGAGALDAIDGAALVDGDTAVVFVGNNPGVAYFYVLDADNAGAESSPDTIAPDANGGDKRWILSTLNGSQGDYGTAANTACAGNDARLPTTAQKAALFDYSATSLTGGGTALDGIDGAGLVDGDTAIVLVGNAPGVLYVYVLDDDDGGAESSPDKIQPDANPGTKMWVLATSNGSMGDYGTTATTACAGNDARIPTTEENAALTTYLRTGLTGGAGTDLDGIASAGLANLDRAVVLVGNAPGTRYYYQYDSDQAGAESSPDIIAPDDIGGGNGRWMLDVVAGEAVGDHVHSATRGGQLTMPVALSDYEAPSDWTWVPTWDTATPEGMTITAKRMFIGKLCQWWLHIVSTDPGAGGGSLTSFEFENDMYPADVGTSVNFPVTGFHRKDTGAADTWTTMQARVDVAAAAGADRKVYLKNPVVWADNEVTELLLSGSHYMA